MRRALAANIRSLSLQSHRRLAIAPVLLFARRDSPEHLPHSIQTAARGITARASPLGSPDTGIVDMEVTRSNFAEALPAVRAALDACAFFAIDCEMTGLFVKPSSSNGREGRPPPFLDDIEERYDEMAESARAFVINQFGLSAFVWDAQAEGWAARTFNFYVFPRPFEDWEPRFLAEAGSLDFLSRCKFDFNKWIYEGVGCMPLALRNAKLAALDRARSRPDILVSKDEDVAFVGATVDAVAAWLGDADGGGPTLLLPAVNAYQRALQYQTLRNGDFGAPNPPGFLVERVGSDADGGRPVLRLSRATPEEAAAFEAAQRRAREDAVREAAAFGEVLEAMQASRKPCVGHNLAFDLAYSLGQFVRALPPTWEEYKDRVGRYFPGGVYDTKYIAGRFPDAFPDTTLGELYRQVMALGRGGDGGENASEDAAMHDASGGASGGGGGGGGEGRNELLDLLFEPSKPPAPAFGASGGFTAAASAAAEAAPTSSEEGAADGLPAAFPAADLSALAPVDHAPGFDRYRAAEGTPAYAHDAGFDAFMTGAVFARLLSLAADGDGGLLGGFDETYGAPAPSMAPLEPLCWRMNLSRSDIEYAALQGDDAVPARQNVLWLTGLPLGEFRHGGDLLRRLALDREAAGGSLRVTLLGRDGAEALVELGTADPEAVAAVAAAVREAVPGAAVRDFEAFRDAKAAARAGVAPGGAGAAGGEGEGGRAKRPRTAGGDRGTQSDEDKGSAPGRCAIM